MSETYYLRSRGKILGPFGVDRLQVMKSRGQLGRSHQVSTDRQTWVAAGTLAELFPVAERTTRVEPIETPVDEAVELALPAANLNPSGGPNAPTAAWFYHVGGQQFGPAPATELRRLLAEGELAPEDMVWRDGMESWSPIEDVPELRPRSAMGLRQPGGNVDGGTTVVATSGLAITSMVLGILSLLIPCLGIITGLLAVIFGGVSLGQINRSRGRLGGRGMAITGLVTGIITLTLYAVYFLLIALGTAAVPTAVDQPW